MKVLKIILKIIVILLIIQIIYVPTVKAGWTDIINQADRFLEQGRTSNEEDEIISETELKRFNNDLYSIIFSTGVILSIIIGAVLGIQIMWGSVEQQSKAKEALIPYLMGCFVIFSAFGIWKIVVNIAEEATEAKVTNEIIIAQVSNILDYNK